MTEQRRCIACSRAIDASAKSCPYCNWDQAMPAPQRSATDSSAAYRPKPKRRWRGRVLGILAFVALLIASFAVGALIHGFDIPSKDDKTTTAATTSTGDNRTAAAPGASSISDLTLVPVNDSSTPIDTPLTTAPATVQNQNLPDEYQRSDATALPSDQYTKIAAATKAEKKSSATIDPRTLSGPAYAAGTAPGDLPTASTARARTEPSPVTAPDGNADGSRSPSAPVAPVRRTDPIPVSQPLPDITVDRNATARLNLTVGTDGRVTEVTVQQTVPGATDKVIAAVQRWRFKPATENGKPVVSTFHVELSFNAHE